MNPNGQYLIEESSYMKAKKIALAIAMIAGAMIANVYGFYY